MNLHVKIPDTRNSPPPPYVSIKLNYSVRNEEKTEQNKKRKELFTKNFLRSLIHSPEKKKNIRRTMSEFTKKYRKFCRDKLKQEKFLKELSLKGIIAERC